MKDPKTASELYRAIISCFPEGPTTQTRFSVTGELYVEWALGVFTKAGLDAEAFLCGKFWAHFLEQAEKAGSPESLTVYFRIKPEYSVVAETELGRAAARLYVRYLLSGKKDRYTEDELDKMVYSGPRVPSLEIEYLEAP